MTNVGDSRTDHLRENKSSFDLLKEKHEKEMNDLYVTLQELLEEFRASHYFSSNREVR